MKTLITVLSITLMSLTGLAHADKIYRWTDENGQTHFGSQPPKSVAKQAEELKIKAQNVPGDARVETVPKQDAPKKQTTTAENQPILPASISAEDAKKNCEIAKNAKQALDYSHNTRFKQEDGSYRPMTPEERTQNSERVDNMMKEFCS